MFCMEENLILVRICKIMGYFERFFSFESFLSFENISKENIVVIDKMFIIWIYLYYNRNKIF